MILEEYTLNGTLFELLSSNQNIMKQSWKRLMEQTEVKAEKFNSHTALFMIFMFLAFWGISFYVLVNSLA
jgi:hypothetical protein